MGKREVITDVRVIVDVPEERWAMLRRKDTDAAYAARLHQRRMDTANELVASIKRHCDLEGDVYVDTVREARCEHCGDAWTEASNVYNGGCCDADEAANPEPRP